MIVNKDTERILAAEEGTATTARESTHDRQTRISPAQMRDLPTKPSCARCIHFKVCGIVRAFIPLMANSYPDEKDESPIDPLELARICREYMPKDSVITT